MPDLPPPRPSPHSLSISTHCMPPPADRIQKAVLDHLVDFHAAYLKAATFFCLATSGPHGLDASPWGGPPGFVHMLDAHTVAYADWPGNNRIESLRNLQSDERVGMLFLFPGLEIFMRINGRGRIVTDGDLLVRFKEGERVPKTATVVQVDEVLLHCVAKPLTAQACGSLKRNCRAIRCRASGQ